MNVKEIVCKFLADNNLDGLVNHDGECGCEIADLMPCGEYDSACQSGYKTPCDCGEGCDFHIAPRDPTFANSGV